jgi:molecular chaperone DnaJ
MESINGCKREIKINVEDECSSCGGSGAYSRKDINVCGRCHGRGSVIIEQNSIFGRVQSQTACPKCGGKGQEITRKCETCGGKGRVRKNKDITITIPAGVSDGMSMRLEGKGAAGYNGGPNGDLYVHVRVKKHEDFQREGDDIYLEIPISITQAVLGDSIEVPTVYGNVTLKIPAGTQSGTKFKLSGRGINNQTTGRTGNQYVIARVLTPTKITQEQKELFTKLSKTDEKSSNSFFEKVKKFFGRKEK